VAPAAAPPRASPAARVLARELHVDLATLTGTGPHGVIERADVERAAAAGAPPPVTAAGAPPPAATAEAPPPAAAATEDRQRGMRQAIAAAMARSKREIPHYYLATTIDLHAATVWLTAQNASRPVTDRLVVAPLLLKAVALALKEVPELNGRWQDGRAVPSAAIHVGVGIALRGGGLVAPGLHDVDRARVASLMERLRDLVNRARAGRLRSSELSDPTITVTSLGDQGVETVFGVIFPPQLAIVGFGRVVERPWVVDGAVAARPVVDATLAADHRASDGHRGARFLAAVARLLQHPEAL
jgi:pyruvate dehydrogenase E2 component (dihydrolipoamide acetyltransferase)